ncbi:MAG: NADH-quinone oxidoreductase subunit J [Chloroflexi bacterium HGW-Chloroflexi-10]|nr:MAG: NADH-quinone oxidoreductase subunit J [Chloroflexi bacterium HGW-Chloroflexi-10]
MPVIGIIFYAFLAVVAVTTAVGMLVNRNAIYAALMLVLNFATVAILYLALGAPFLALTQITVYAGAIMVLFLFVITLLGAEMLPGKEPLKGHRTAAMIMALIFVVEVVLFLVFRNQVVGPIAEVSLEFGSPHNIGVTMFTQYLLPLEIIGIILLSATVGAIILTKPEKKVANYLPQGKE